MNKQDQFWHIVDEMERDAKSPGRNTSVTAKEFEALKGSLKTVFGEKAATSFVRLSIHLSSRATDAKHVITMLRDLKVYDWNYEKTMKELTNSRNETGFNSYIYSGNMDPQVRLFARDNFEQLTGKQQNSLSIYRP